MAHRQFHLLVKWAQYRLSHRIIPWAGWSGWEYTFWTPSRTGDFHKCRCSMGPCHQGTRSNLQTKTALAHTRINDCLKAEEFVGSTCARGWWTLLLCFPLTQFLWNFYLSWCLTPFLHCRSIVRLRAVQVANGGAGTPLQPSPSASVGICNVDGN